MDKIIKMVEELYDKIEEYTTQKEMALQILFELEREELIEHFVIYKIKKGRQRKDGSRLVVDYGCNLQQHAQFHSYIWFDETGESYGGSFKTSFITGNCDGTCKLKGGFIINKMEKNDGEK